MLTLIAWISIITAILSAVYIYLNTLRSPESMKIMNIVWILTALWGSLGALLLYRRWSSPKAPNHMDKMADMPKMDMMPKMNMMAGMDMSVGMVGGGKMDMAALNPPQQQRVWRSVALSALHCGAGCALADLVGEGITYYLPLAIGGSLIAGSWTLDFLLALLFGVFFQYKAMQQMQPSIPRKQLVARAAKADILSLIAWQVGMYGWMAICYFVIFPSGALLKDSATFWLMMQIAMLAGFCTALPVNYLLIRVGLKKEM